VLDLSKAEAGKLRLAEDIVDVAAIVAECVSMVAAQASAGGVQLGDETPQDLPMLRVDRRATKQMLLNLLSNAVKFTGKGGSVTVTGAGIATGGVVLAVRDTGIGIAPEDIARALAPFEQVDSGHTRRYAGTGLGLALVQKLIDLHGGRLVLESAVGVGTTATLHFPAGRVCLAPAVPQSRSPGRPARSRDGMLSNF
jgi:signal transduction histidine kinase